MFAFVLVCLISTPKSRFFTWLSILVSQQFFQKIRNHKKFLEGHDSQWHDDEGNLKAKLYLLLMHKANRTWIKRFFWALLTTEKTISLKVSDEIFKKEFPLWAFFYENIFLCPFFSLSSPTSFRSFLMNFFSNMATLFLIEFNPFISTFNEACSFNRLKGHYLEIVRKSPEFFSQFLLTLWNQSSWRKIESLITKIAVDKDFF